MNGLDDYKNILSGGIRIVQTGVVPTFGNTADTPTVALGVGEAFTTAMVSISESQSDGSFNVNLTESSEVYIFTMINYDQTFIYMSYASENRIYKLQQNYMDEGTTVRLKSFRVVDTHQDMTDNYICYTNCSWLVLRIA